MESGKAARETGARGQEALQDTQKQRLMVHRMVCSMRASVSFLAGT